MAGDRRVVRTRAALTAALFELLGEKEFSKISITELARRAGVDRKTFYLHYQSVGEVLEGFYEEALRRIQAGLEREGVFQGEEIDMQGFFRVLCGVMSEHMSLCRRLAQGGGYTYFMERIRAVLRQPLERHFRRRGVHGEAELQLLGEFYAAGIIQVYLEWMKGELVMGEAALAQTVGKAVSGALPL